MTIITNRNSLIVKIHQKIHTLNPLKSTGKCAFNTTLETRVAS